MARSPENRLTLEFGARAFWRRDSAGLGRHGQQPLGAELSGRLANLPCVAREATVPEKATTGPEGSLKQWGAVGSRRWLCQRDAIS